MSISRRIFLKNGTIAVSAFGFAESVFAGDGSNLNNSLKNIAVDVEPLNRQDYEERLERAKIQLKNHGIDALFLSGSVNLRYFTGTSWGRSERTFGAVIQQNGEPYWVCPRFELERATERITFKKDVRTWEEHESPYKLIADVMKEIGAGSGRLGIGPTVRNFVVEGLRKEAAATGFEIVDGEAVTHGCRVIKSAKELEYMELANKITKTAYKRSFEQLKEGMSAGALAGIVRQEHSKQGVSGGGWPLFGQNSAYPHGSSVRRDLTDGSIVLLDGGCSVEGYQSDVTRTIVFGKPTDKQKRVWDIVKQAQTAAQNAVHPGVECQAVDHAARKVIEDAGYGPDYKYFTHRVGHGIGMEGHEYSYLVKGNTLKLQPGMTFSNEPGIYIYGEFGVRIEDCFKVTPDGARFLGGMESAALDHPFVE